MNLETFNVLLIIDLRLTTFKKIPSTFPIYELRNLAFLMQIEHVYMGKVRGRIEHFGEKRVGNFLFSLILLRANRDSYIKKKKLLQYHIKPKTNSY